jgi:hypothetical protein
MISFLSKFDLPHARRVAAGVRQGSPAGFAVGG